MQSAATEFTDSLTSSKPNTQTQLHIFSSATHSLSRRRFHVDENRNTRLLISCSAALHTVSRFMSFSSDFLLSDSEKHAGSPAAGVWQQITENKDAAAANSRFPLFKQTNKQINKQLDISLRTQSIKDTVKLYSVIWFHTLTRFWQKPLGKNLSWILTDIHSGPCGWTCTKPALRPG